MGIPVGAVDTFLHLAVFLAGGVTVAVVGLMGLERLGGSASVTVRVRHVLLALGCFAGLVLAERVFHVVT